MINIHAIRHLDFRVRLIRPFLCILFLAGCQQETTLKQIPPGGTILCFGDSLTHGVGASSGRNYPSVLSELTGHRVINSGKPGETSSQGLTRLPTVLRNESPALVVLCHGGNDILQRLDYETTKANVVAMINLCKKNEVQVVLIAVPSILSDSHPLYAQAAHDTEVPIDTSSLGTLIRTDAYTSDQVHLNDMGYKKLAEAVYTRLKADGAL
ncbi:hypothetical protein BVX99_03170 [bacterium F16]|nr:hypothetical protein BVX99_03170 [bacterium F16]